VRCSCTVDRREDANEEWKDAGEIIALYEELGSYRAVGSLLGCDHKRYVQAAGEAGQLAPALHRARVTDDFAGLIAGRVEQSGGRVTARRLMRIMRAAGYEGSERSLRRALAEAKAAWRARQALEGRVYRPWVSEPGEWMLCDWGGRGRSRQRRARARRCTVTKRRPNLHCEGAPDVSQLCELVAYLDNRIIERPLNRP
jgi:hypothetical protein